MRLSGMSHSGVITEKSNALNVLKIKTYMPYCKPGKPLKFTLKHLQDGIIYYFNECKKLSLHPTVCGLALCLGTTRVTLKEYENNGVYASTIKEAKNLIESYKNQLLLDKDRPVGVIFDLKNNHGWIDKVEHVNTGEININIKREDNEELIELARLYAASQLEVVKNEAKMIDVTPVIENKKPRGRPRKS